MTSHPLLKCMAMAIVVMAFKALYYKGVRGCGHSYSLLFFSIRASCRPLAWDQLHFLPFSSIFFPILFLITPTFSTPFFQNFFIIFELDLVPQAK